LDALTECFWPDVVQAPINAFDQRIIDSCWSERLVERGTEIHARSVFLQGLLLSKNLRTNGHFETWDKQLDFWFSQLETYGITPLEGALAAVANTPSITKIVVGLNSFKQFEQITLTCKSLAKRGTTINISAFKTDEYNLIDPRRWLVR